MECAPKAEKGSAVAPGNVLKLLDIEMPPRWRQRHYVFVLSVRPIHVNTVSQEQPTFTWTQGRND